MKQSFVMEFNGYEIVLPKKSVDFKYGYGVVNAQYNIIYEDVEYSVDLIGLVDTEFKPIIKLTPLNILPKIEIFPYNRLIITYDNNQNLDYNDYSVYMGIIENKVLNVKYNLASQDFNVISNSVVKIFNEFENGRSMCTLFDIDKEEMLLPFVSYIGEFIYDKNYGEKRATVFIDLAYSDNKDYIRVEFKINTKGQVLEPYYNHYADEYYDKEWTIEEVINYISKDYYR